MFDILCVFTASFLGAFSAFLFGLMKEQQSEKQAYNREEKLCALKYEQPVPLTVENLIALREALPPFVGIVWCLGYNEFKSICMLQDGAGKYVLTDANKLFGDSLVMVQLSLPGHEVSIAYTPLGTKKAVNADLWLDLPEPDLQSVGRMLSEVRREMG